MKNYYYFLGVSQEASEDEIRKAYRKLSPKYHPDHNDNDDFLAMRFQELNEAYETLINPEKRMSYDQILDKNTSSLKSTFPPYIKTFSANKTYAEIGDEIIIKWQTNNADLVKILPFGLEKSYGERIFRITQFKEGKFQIVIQATNTNLKKSVVQGITIKEGSQYKNENLANENQTSSVSPKIKSPKGNHFIFILLIIFIIISILLLLM